MIFIRLLKSINKSKIPEFFFIFISLYDNSIMNEKKLLTSFITIFLEQNFIATIITIHCTYQSITYK